MDAGSGLFRARWLLADAVGKALDGWPDNGQAIRRVVVDVEGGEGVSPLLWLREQTLGPKSCWSGREQDAAETAAVGIADIVTDGEGQTLSEAIGERITPALRDSDPGVRYFGGARFDASSDISREWESFGGYRFVLPRFEFVRDGDGCHLVCNLVLPRDRENRGRILSELGSLASPETVRSGEVFPPASFTSRADEPGREGWTDNIHRALDAFEAGELGKVVMARRATITFDGDVDAADIARRLRAATPGCFHFYFEPEGREAFIGASPERLYSRRGRAVRSEAVAGTRPRGESSPDDEDLRDELLGSDKDRAEHSFVKKSIAEDLRPLCEALKVEEGVSEMRLASRRHLVSRVRGTLREDVADAGVLEALHPTPAVGGYPKEAAKAEIRASETFDRGWYAGPVGWISNEAAEFAVGIRSALARGNELALYSGAGIVPGSTPGGEWAEIEQKVSDFLEILGLDRTLDGSRQHAAR